MVQNAVVGSATLTTQFTDLLPSPSSFQALLGLGSSYLLNWISWYTSTHLLWFSDRLLLAMPCRRIVLMATYRLQASSLLVQYSWSGLPKWMWRVPFLVAYMKAYKTCFRGHLVHGKTFWQIWLYSESPCCFYFVNRALCFEILAT